jgi:heme A synthase
MLALNSLATLPEALRLPQLLPALEEAHVDSRLLLLLLLLLLLGALDALSHVTAAAASAHSAPHSCSCVLVSCAAACTSAHSAARACRP